MIKAAAFCLTCSRTNNEDNYYLNGYYLPEIHGDDEWEGSLQGAAVFGVFDGLGGHREGEKASFIAAKHFQAFINEEDVTRQVRQLNRTILDLTNNSGTTVAGITFTGSRAIFFNLGDSRIYLYRDHSLKQISFDHIMKSPFGGTTITQCLGIPESEFILQPYIRSLPLKGNDLFILCSDGVTNVLHDRELSDILAGSKDINTVLKRLKNTVTERKAADNTTVILCRAERRG